MYLNFVILAKAAVSKSMIFRRKVFLGILSKKGI